MYGRHYIETTRVLFLPTLLILAECFAKVQSNCTMAQNCTYTIHPLEAEDADKVMQLLQRTFFIDEPLNKAIGLCDDGVDKCTDLAQYCNESLREGLSLKAIDQDNNIIGVMISGAYPIKENDILLTQAKSTKNAKFQKILYILARRETGAKLWEKYPQDENLVEVKVAATDPKWRRKGIMNSLLRRTEKIVQERHIRILRIDTSSAYSAMSAERQGFHCVYKELYTDIKMNGQPIIVPEPPHLEDRVYVKELF